MYIDAIFILLVITYCAYDVNIEWRDYPGPVLSSWDRLGAFLDMTSPKYVQVNEKNNFKYIINYIIMKIDIFFSFKIIII